MKQAFFKTVRINGRSVWAAKQYARHYVFNGRYEFSSEQPAHVFGLWQDLGKGMWRNAPLSLDEQLPPQDFGFGRKDLIYVNRAAPMGCRVLLCYGEAEVRSVKVCEVNYPWDFSKARDALILTSRDFTVLGEIHPSFECKEHADRESSSFVDSLKVQLDFNEVKQFVKQGER